MKKVIDDGGKAHPVLITSKDFYGRHEHHVSGGMSLRDYFAAQALAGEFAAQNEYNSSIFNEISDDWVKGRAMTFYRFADAMIAARKEGIHVVSDN